MSELYPDLDKTTFPEAIDQRYIMIDPSTASDLTAINSYNSYIDAGNMSAALGVLTDNPRLQRMMFNADKWNRHEDMIIAMQRYYDSDVQDYLVNIITYRGEWSNSVGYEKYDVVIVTQPGTSEAYMAISNVPTNTQPPNQTYWVPLTLKGDKGESGTGLSWRGTWGADTQYYQDDCVTYNNILWAATADNIADTPGDASANWEQIMAVDMTAQVLLDKLKTVDGSGSGLDADLLDGQDSSYYAKQSDMDLTASDEDLTAHINDGSKHFGINPTANVDGTLYRADAAPTGTTILKYSGYFTATRVYGSYFSDYAEYFDATSDCVDGDVVEIDIDSPFPNRFRRCETEMSPFAIGIVSHEHYICIGRREHCNNVPVALAGKVHVNIKGSCKRGDFLVSAGDGRCRALVEGEQPPIGCVLAQAIDNCKDGDDKVYALVMRR